MKAMWCCLVVLIYHIWVSSDLVECLVQASVSLLCFLAFFAQSNRTDRDTGTQTDTELSPPVQTNKTAHILSRDEPDSCKAAQVPSHRLQCPIVHKSLQNMFTCAYTHLVLPWYTVPEPREDQPLHSALLREFDFITDRIVGNSMNLDVSVISMDCIRIFTQHLRNVKQSDGSAAYSCRADEMTVLRDLSRALVHNLLPQHLCEQELFSCALQEILATRVLALVTLLSDPNNLNSLLVSHLGESPSERSEKEVKGSAAEGRPPSVEREDADRVEDQPVEESSDESKSRKKARKLKERLSNFFGNLKSKKAKKRKMKKESGEPQMDPSLFKCAALGSDVASENSFSVSGSDLEGDVNTTPEEMMEFKLSYEMWRAGKWTVRVTNVQEESGEMIFTIHLNESGSPENLHWDVKKTRADIVEFYSHFKETSLLPSIATIVENPHSEFNEDSKGKARTDLEQFLQALVVDTELGDTEQVFRFLCPVHKLLSEERRDGGMWLFLGSLASFLTFDQEEDDELNNIKGEEKPCKIPEKDGLAKVTPPCDVTQTANADTVDGHGKEHGLMDSGSPFDGNSTCTSVTRVTDGKGSRSERTDVDCAGRESLDLAGFADRVNSLLPKVHLAALCDDGTESLGQGTAEAVSDHSARVNVNKKGNQTRKMSLQSDKPKNKEKAPRAKDETPSLPQEQGKIPCISDKPEVNKVIFDLLKEISGNSHIFKIIKAILLPFTPMIKMKVNAFITMMIPSEAQIARHIDGLCKILWPEEVVSPEPSRRSEDRNKTKDKAIHLIISKFAGYLVLNKADLENMFQMFQDPEENKKLIYMLLVYLLRKFLPGESFTVISLLNVKDSV
ncbi:uncharacterized protein LOC143526639 isoform X1 [Brachyhypopomus gauderio]|uniref:uncharacterized protein LOC143526639 isoform X1 n=1 Tax=Brachyhypopomus gauderio TaxID=698409 RepID=UPI004041BF87